MPVLSAQRATTIRCSDSEAEQTPDHLAGSTPEHDPSRDAFGLGCRRRDHSGESQPKVFLRGLAWSSPSLMGASV